MTTKFERFEDYERHCGAQLSEEPTEVIEREQEGPDGEVHTFEVERFERCDNTLTFEENHAGMRHLDGFEGRVHVLRCDECGERHGVCPVCTNAEGSPGYFRGETTGDMLACHVCNAREYARQTRRGY